MDAASAAGDAAGSMTATSADPAVPPRPRGFDPARLARTIRRATLPLAIVAAIVFFQCFGSMRVPEGMDSMPDIPPGSLCLIDKRSGSARPGKAVFVDVPAGGTLLSRVVAVGADGSLRVQNDSPTSALPDSDQFGELPAKALRGTVMVVFAASAKGPAVGR